MIDATIFRLLDQMNGDGDPLTKVAYKMPTLPIAYREDPAKSRIVPHNAVRTDLYLSPYTLLAYDQLNDLLLTNAVQCYPITLFLYLLLSFLISILL